MKFGYTIVYVPDVAQSLQFFEQAFGFTRKFLHESNTYGELATGETTLAFAAHELAESNFPQGHVAASASAKPLGMELGFVTDDVAGAHARAIAAGASVADARDAIAPVATRAQRAGWRVVTLDARTPAMSARVDRFVCGKRRSRSIEMLDRSACACWMETAGFRRPTT